VAEEDGEDPEAERDPDDALVHRARALPPLGGGIQVL
jgi:hypothetical protein